MGRVKSDIVAVVLLGLVVLSVVVALPVTKTEEKKKEEAKAAGEEHHIKYDEGLAEDDPRNRPDVSSARVLGRNSCL